MKLCNDKIEIRPFGNYLPQDKNGFIINDLSIEKIDKKWLPVLAIVVKSYRQKLGESLLSVYLRGSVARNFAIDNISDLDTFALVKPAFGNQKIRWQKVSFEAETFYVINEKYPFFCDLEMNIATFEETFLKSKLAMIVKTQSLLLFGQDLARQIKNYKADEEMILNLNWLAGDLAAFLVIGGKGFELKDCQKIMKVILRSGFELVLGRVGKFSPDLYICYRDFSKFYPEKEAEMRQALDWFLNPVLDKKTLNYFVNNFGNWLLAEFTFVKEYNNL